MANALELQALLNAKFADYLQSITVQCDRVIIEVAAHDLKAVSYLLRDDAQLQFTSLMDVAGVDYSQYGLCEWDTTQASISGFSRGVEARDSVIAQKTQRPRYGVVYQLLSITHNHRLTLRTYAQGEPPMLDSVIEIWPSANWNEREVFDLYGVIFRDHPDLRRILTDYGFIGHPFRKDFPLSGEVEVRYDATTQRVVYEPVDIKPRVLVPKVIRTEETGAPAALDSIGK